MGVLILNPYRLVLIRYRMVRSKPKVQRYDIETPELHPTRYRRKPTGGELMREKAFICKGCNKTEDILAMFPNDLCLICYAMTPEANRPITARELSQMWGGK